MTPRQITTTIRPTAKIRPVALERDRYTCQLCGLQPQSRAVLQIAFIKGLSEGGTPTLDNVVTLCANCHASADAAADRNYLGEIIRQSPGAIVGLRQALEKIRALNVAPLPSAELAVALRNLLFANAVAALETYLSDTIVGAVTGERLLTKRAIANVPELRDRKVELRNLFDRVEKIDTEVRDYLLEIIYHNLGKIKPLYASVLNVRLPDDISDMIHAINTRHDIVHRNGKGKDGRPIMCGEADVEEVARLVEQFVEVLESQVQQKPWRQ